jgi:MFS family permease
MIFLLSFQYFFGSLSGASWNSWMKDLVPGKVLGSYFSKRTRLIQILSVTLSFAIALVIDYVKSHYPQYEIITYSVMFVIGGVIGMIGVYLLSRAPEPKTTLTNEKLSYLFAKPLKDRNFRKLLTFHSFYAFATSMALPFFVVYMMKTLGLPFYQIIILGLIAKFGSIISIKFWGTYSDKYSNKTIISICAPTFTVCIFLWSFTGMHSSHVYQFLLLAIIHLVSGISAAGVDLGINNIALKLAPRNEAIAYISTRNIVVAAISSTAPLIGGLMADFFANRHLTWAIEWHGPAGISKIPLLALHNWSFFFVIGAVLAMFSLRFLKSIKEEGEVEKDKVIVYMRTRVRRDIRKNMSPQAIVYRINHPVILPMMKQKMITSFIKSQQKVEIFLTGNSKRKGGKKAA